jgi:mRNA-degrading endonuclease toxin of MazEF toxin-antitoxin module
MHPGEIYWCESADGRRPAVVVSRELLNRGDDADIVLCTSSRFELRSKLPNCVPFRASEFGLGKDCVAQCETISFIPLKDLDVAFGPIGTLDARRLREVIRVIGYVVEAECEPE